MHACRSTLEDPTTGNVIANDTDVDSVLTPASVTGYTQAAHGSVAYNSSNGTFTYTPVANYNGSDNFTYTLSDGSQSSTASVNVTVNAVNDAPLANDDAASGNEDTLITTGNVVANDSDVDNALGGANVLSYSQAAHGAVTYNHDGSFNYAPEANFSGADSFTYTIGDGASASTATVHVTVNAVDDAPVATDDTASGDENTDILTSDVLANDTDIDSTLFVSDWTGAAHGEVLYLGAGAFKYTPDENFSGVDTFRYTASDGTLSSTATVTVTVNRVDVPIDPMTVIEDGVGHSVALSLGDVGSTLAGFRIVGENFQDLAGSSVAAAGDVNGDGIADLLVGAIANDAAGQESGAAYVVFGKADLSEVRLSDIADGIGGFKIRAEAVNDYLAGDPQSIAGIGDMNGDGKADLLIGSVYNNYGDGYGAETGAAYVVYGKADGASVDLTDVAAGIGGYKLTGEDRAQLGVAVSSVADMNGDGRAELLIGNYEAPDRDWTGAYVVYGHDGNAPVNMADVAAGIGGFRVVAAPGDNNGLMGQSVAGLGDVNGDGRGDFAVGASWSSSGGESFNGTAYVVFGKDDGAAVQLSDVAMGRGGYQIVGEAEGDSAGYRVASAGDVNGDGRADLIVSALDNDAAGISAGAAYVVFGKSDTASVYLGDVADGSGGFRIVGEHPADRLAEVSSIGDINGDGLSELMVASRIVDAGGHVDSGAAYIVYGKTDGAEVKLADVALGFGGFKVYGDESQSYSGWSISGLGDINSDGRPDLAIGSPFHSNDEGVSTGGAYVVFSPEHTGPNGVLTGDVVPDDAAGTVIGVHRGMALGGVDIEGGVGETAVGTYGTFTMTEDGRWTYALDDRNPDTQALMQDETAGDFFSYTIADADGNLSTSHVTINVIGTNDAPLAINSMAAMNAHTQLHGVLTAVDPDLPSEMLDYSISQAPTQGSVTLDGGGAYTYTPNANYPSGTDFFSFMVADEQGVTTTANVSIRIDTSIYARNYVGTDGRDTMIGGDGADTFSGGAADDVLVGNGGADRLTGGSGSDLFHYNAIGDKGDVITDFTPGEGGDVLDLHDVLAGYTPGLSNASDYVQFTESGGDTLISLNADGAANDAALFITLQGVTGLTVDALMANGNMVL